MKTSFDIIDDILHTKEVCNISAGDECSVYIVNKGISFYSPQYNQLINQTGNVYSKVLTPQQMVDFLQLLFPKSQKRRGTWITHKRQKTATENDTIKVLANNMEISSKHINDMIDIFPDLLDDYIEEDKRYTRI